MITLRDYQQDAHEKTILHCRSSNKPAFHNHSVGAGKTILIAFDMLNTVNKGGRALCLARQGELIEQNSDDYRLIGGKCSIYSASLNRASTFYPAVFGTEGTVYRAIQSDFKSLLFDLLTIDECHMVDWQDVLECMKDVKENNFDYNANQTKDGKTKYSQYAVIITHLYRINPKLRIIGYTGSPYRGKTTIIGGFWERDLTEVSTYELIERGFLVPPVFGFGDESHNYDLSEFKPAGGEGAQDFTKAELNAMARKITKSQTMTENIIDEVLQRTQNRLGVMITCASKKHCEQVAECLPDGTWGIITDSTSTKERRRILKGAKLGDIKYLIQIGCLTTGVNIPRLDTSVILRKIGSLTLLIQLLGRALRTLKPEQIEAGLVKHDALILDYTDTLESMGAIYEDPVLDKAVAQFHTETAKSQECPKCGTMNGEYAVRCIGINPDNAQERCDHFFKSVMCFNCMTENSPSAKNCRACDAVIVDPNRNLLRKAYTEADYKPVISMDFEIAKNGNGIWVKYPLNSTYIKQGIEYPEVAKEYFEPFSREKYAKERWRRFVFDHICSDKFRLTMLRHRDIDSIIRGCAIFDKPVEITHRVNDKFFSVINRKKFLSGRETRNS